MKKCIGNPKSELRPIQNLPDIDLQDGIAHHADPKWWKEAYVVKTNQAYLRRYGSMLRREARKRGLL